MNRMLEAMATHRKALRGTRPHQLARLAKEDVSHSGPTTDAQGVSAYAGERAIAHALRAAEDQKLYYHSETLTAGIAALMFAGITVTVFVHYFL